MTKSRLIAYILATLLLIILTLPLTFPFGLVIPNVEKKVGELLQARVSIGAMAIRFTPAPVLALDRVVIDTEETASIAEITIPVNFYNVLHLGKKFKAIQTREARLSKAFAQSLPQRIHPDENGIRVQKLEMNQSTVVLESMSVGPVDSVLNFESNGQIFDLTLADTKGQAQLRLLPTTTAGQFNLEFSARGWTLPLGYPAQFEYLSMRGVGSEAGIEITDVRGDAYSGMISGKGNLNWQNGWKLTGEYTIKNAQAESLIKLFSPATYSTGRLSSTGTFSYAGTGYKDLFDQPQVQGSFVIMNGRAHNMDLVAPLKSQSPETQRRGGQTEFNLLAGRFGASQAGVQIAGLKLDGGKLRVGGEVRIREGAIAGSLYSQLSSGSMTIAAPLALTGKLESPELRSTGAIRNRATLPDEADIPAITPVP